MNYSISVENKPTFFLLDAKLRAEVGPIAVHHLPRREVVGIKWTILWQDEVNTEVHVVNLARRQTNSM